MHRLIEFIKRIYVVLLFLLIEGVAIWCYATATPYNESKILSRTSALGAWVSGGVNHVQHFFALPEQNERLTHRIASLEKQLQMRDITIAELCPDSLNLPVVTESDARFTYHPVRVVSMTTNRKHNYIVLNKGAKDGIGEGMGVITPNRELVGSVVSCSENYSVAISVLNTRFKIGGNLIDNDYVCSIYWDGVSSYELNAVELSKYAEPRKGMVVNVKSERMPLDIVIGTIERFEINATKSAYSADVKIAADMQRLDNLLVVENSHQREIDALVEEVDK